MPRGRPAKPMSKHSLNSGKHLTKREKKERGKGELRVLNSGVFVCPAYVKADRVAKAKWDECMGVFDSIAEWGIISTGDSGFIARYCLAFSEYRDLIERRKAIITFPGFNDREEITLDDEFHKEGGSAFAKQLWKKIDVIVSTAGLLQIDAAINKKTQQLMAMEDRLFLNPLAKVKNIVKKNAEEKKSSPIDEFDL